MNTHDLLHKGQPGVLGVFPLLIRARHDEPNRRRQLLSAMRDRVRDQGRVARCIYGPLLRHGGDPNLVLATFHSQAAVDELLGKMEGEVADVRCWLGSVTLLRCLVREHFENQEAPLRGAGHFFGTDPELLAPTYSSVQSSAAVGSAAASDTRLGGSDRDASANAAEAAAT